MKEEILKYHDDYLTSSGFSLNSSADFSSMGQCWKLAPSLGEGHYWIYSHKDLFAITIHNFYFHDNFIMNYPLMDNLSIAYYSSISGEELNPYKRLTANTVHCHFGKDRRYNAIIHKKIPVNSIGIEISPAYYEKYLQNEYPMEYTNPGNAFLSINECDTFPELVLVMNQIKAYRGTGIAANLFYEAKIAELLSIIIERSKKLSRSPKRALSSQDIAQIDLVSSYINDHYASTLPLDLLSKISGMSVSKLKNDFKESKKCTITEYIQQRRMAQAEQLLLNSSLPIGQIGQLVGYSCASRFSKLFYLSTGFLPREYRVHNKTESQSYPCR